MLRLGLGEPTRAVRPHLRGLGEVDAVTEITTSFFSRLPKWAQVLFAIVYPVSIPYAIYRMWKTGRYTQWVRVTLTAVAAIFLAVALIPTPADTSSSTVQVPPKAKTASEDNAASEPESEDSAEEVAPETDADVRSEERRVGKECR